jgi:hypothetical protein
MSSKPRNPTRQQLWRKRNPKSYLAHLSVQNALNLGVLKRQPCEVCGGEKSEAHHPDYERPYDVVWLCRKHHKAVHSKRQRKNGSG